MISRLFNPGLSCIAVLFVSACSDPGPAFFAEGSPTRLSEWKLFLRENNTLRPHPATLVFEPANPLFTDYAGKLRTMWIPAGEAITMDNGEFVYPVGTVLSKTFYYGDDGRSVSPNVIPGGARLIETRLLVRRESGWQAFPYVWNGENTEAFLRVAGTSTEVSLATEDGVTRFTYFVPNENQCAGCHVTEHPDGELHPLGAIAGQLHVQRRDERGALQTEALIARGWLKAFPSRPQTVSWQDDNPLGVRAMAYLNIHCGHCHNPQGSADTSSLILDGSHRNPTEMGVCKTPVAAGGGASDRLYSIVPGQPDRSIVVYRMESNEPDEMMPELGRSLVHEEGVNLIREWIGAMPGECP